MMMAAIQGAEDFIDGAPSADKYWVQKVLFADTDLSKYANVAMRSNVAMRYVAGAPAAVLPPRQGGQDHG